MASVVGVTLLNHKSAVPTVPTFAKATCAAVSPPRSLATEREIRGQPDWPAVTLWARTVPSRTIQLSVLPDVAKQTSGATRRS